MAWRYITYRFCLHLMLLLWVSAVLPGLTLSTSINSSKRVSWFGETNLKNTTTLLLSEDSNTLYVGARDSVVFLDVSQPGTLKLQNKVNLSPSEEEIADCTKKVDNPRLKCSNFIRILLQLNKTHYIICGTNAFKPTYMYFDPKTFTITRPGDGKRPNANGICPFDPYQKYTAMIVGGELYTGLMGNFQANLPVIRRSLVTERRKSLNIEMWLNDPAFAGSFSFPEGDPESRVYFFFSEVGNEYTFFENIFVPRIAQVCMNDNGGTLVQQNIWTTFAKAEIRCPSSKKLPYNIIQDIFALTPAKNDSSNEILFYGIFTSQWPESLGKSAVCVFRMNDIKAVFTGGYLKFNKDTQRWNRETRQDLRPGTCEQKTDNTIFELKDIYLMDSFIRPVGHKPILESYEHLYTKITVQRVKAANMKTYIILFLLTASGSFHKVVMEDGEIRFNETIQLFTEPQPVTNLLLSAEKNAVFVGSSEGIFQIAIHSCTSYQSCNDCVQSKDPFCGWDFKSEVCTTGLVETVKDQKCHSTIDPAKGSSSAGVTSSSPIMISLLILLSQIL